MTIEFHHFQVKMIFETIFEKDFLLTLSKHFRFFMLHTLLTNDLRRQTFLNIATSGYNIKISLRNKIFIDST